MAAERYSDSFSYDDLVFRNSDYYRLGGDLSVVPMLQAMAIVSTDDPSELRVIPEPASDPRNNLLYAAYLVEIFDMPSIDMSAVTQHYHATRYPSDVTRPHVITPPIPADIRAQTPHIERAFSTIATRDYILSPYQRLAIGATAVVLYQHLQATTQTQQTTPISLRKSPLQP
jgi:hypothetical protein